MAVFVTMPEGAGHVGYFLNRYGRRWSRRMSEITYVDLARKTSVPSGVYIFCDRDRMSEPQRRLAAILWEQLVLAGGSVRLLNHPLKQLGRYELLKELHEDGINDFGVWPVAKLGDQVRFPVFVRRENDHFGVRSGLIHDGEELFRTLSRLVLAGFPSRDLLVVEYCDTRDPGGLYRKYGAQRVGERVFGQHVLLTENWDAKAQGRLRTPQALEENRTYFYENPHADLLMPLFEAARIEYGRIDYSLREGRIQVWEINDNPRLASPNPSYINKESKELVYLEALAALDEGLEPGPPIGLSGWGPGLWDALFERSLA